MDGGAWWATAHGVAKSRTQLSEFTFTHWNTFLTRKQNDSSLYIVHESIYFKMKIHVANEKGKVDPFFGMITTTLPSAQLNTTNDIKNTFGEIFTKILTMIIS